MEVLEQFRLDGKVALITGGKSGLGSAYATGLAEAGADIASFDLSESKETVENVQKLGKRAISIVGDVAKEQDAHAAVDRTVKELGGLDILINNAGIGGTFTPVHLHTLDDWEKVVAVNLRGVFLFCREALKVMVEQKNGKIINVGSIWGLVGSSLLMPAPAYNATKGAVINLTRELALEYGPLGININCLAPAFFRSGLGDGAYDNPEVVKAMEATLPMGKIGNTDDLNGTIVYMASSASDFMNGHTLVVDMGYTAR